MPPETGFLALRDRAVAMLSSGGAVAEDILLAHVYGGDTPPALRARLVKPLLDDPRLVRKPDGRWALAGVPTSAATDVPLPDSAFTALALIATGPRPARARLVRLSALHVAHREIVERFSATLDPAARVPRYVADRAGVAPDALNDLPAFETVLDDLLRFLEDRPICAQEAVFTYGFIEAEVRRLGRTLPPRVLIDVNRLSEHVLDLRSKPTLGSIAQRLGISSMRIEHVDEEARVIATVVPRLLERAETLGSAVASDLQTTLSAGTTELSPLRRGATARAFPDAPGVYVMRDADRSPLYVGKARRLSSRVAAYVHRPLGPARRLEGLAAAVEAVEAQVCATDLEALVLEDREIRRLQPRFNTQRRQRPPRTWIYLKRFPKAPPRLELGSDPKAERCVGPFRNEAVARDARSLASNAFDLDDLRQRDSERYVNSLENAWAFLGGNTEVALARVREKHAAAVAARDDAAARRMARLLAGVRDYDPIQLVLPADPRFARYAVLRPFATSAQPTCIEALVLDHGILVGSLTFDPNADDIDSASHRLLDAREPRTEPDDINVVLRWFGAQRPPARLVLLPDGPAEAANALAAAANDLWLELRSDLEHLLDGDEP